MKGTLRIILGFFLVFGAVGTMDYDPNASLLASLVLAVVGLISMFSGANALENT
jgi:hypothetical protein